MERTLIRLGKWLVRRGLWQTLEAVTPELGTAYLRHFVHDVGISRKTVGKYVSFLRNYWTWLVDHGHLPPGTAPWSAPIPKPKATGRHTEKDPDQGKRPYTSDELLKLLNGKPSNPVLPDLIRIGALSGMRLEEMYRLRVRDAADLDFHQIAAAKLAVDRQVKKRSIPNPSLAVEEKADRPDLFDLQCALGADLPPAFQAGLPAAAGSYCEIPITFLLRPKRPERKQIWQAKQRRVPTPLRLSTLPMMRTECRR